MGLLARGRFRRFAAVAALVFAAAGCNQGTGRGVLSGKVLLDGKPLPGGTVTFVPTQGGANTVWAKIDETGSFGPVEVPVGEVQVAVDNRYLAPPPPRVSFDPTSQMKRVSPARRKESAEAAQQKPPAPAATPSGNYVPIPEKYCQVESSGIKLTVERGTHQEDIKLASKP